MPVVYLISGANRGIGFGLVNELAMRPDAIVFAGTRKADSDTTAKLQEVVKAHPGRVHVVKLTSGDAADNAAAIESVREKAGRLDVVIANAGLGRSAKPVVEESTDELRAHWDVNVGGPHTLFKAAFPLLRDSPRSHSDPPSKFVVISSTGGSILLETPVSVSYGASKAAVNFLTRKIHFEHEKDGLVAFPICPGNVATDMWDFAVSVSPEFASMTPQSLEENAKALLTVIDNATRETCGGKFMSQTGDERPW